MKRKVRKIKSEIETKVDNEVIDDVWVESLSVSDLEDTMGEFSDK